MIQNTKWKLLKKSNILHEVLELILNWPKSISVAIFSFCRRRSPRYFSPEATFESHFERFPWNLQACSECDRWHVYQSSCSKNPRRVGHISMHSSPWHSQSQRKLWAVQILEISSVFPVPTVCVSVWFHCARRRWRCSVCFSVRRAFISSSLYRFMQVLFPFSSLDIQLTPFLRMKTNTSPSTSCVPAHCDHLHTATSCMFLHVIVIYREKKHACHFTQQ